ncbi:hypothetical protein [Nocardioides malaquae]|uniref:hypothetical protein n=1 Tax=Nocardioides malaquae TaxID=2773426 RepID=UPI0018792A4C|nr:hypothetical protein [Nocardioides malaquae]
MVTDYRFSPAVTARLLGVTMLFMAALVAAATLGVAVANWHGAVLLVPALVVIVVVVGLMAWSNGWVVRLTEDGYRVRRIRGAGVTAARWKDVEDAVTTEVLGSRCVVLRLRDGRTTTIPVDSLHADREQFARTVGEHLTRGHGIRPLGG